VARNGKECGACAGAETAAGRDSARTASTRKILSKKEASLEKGDYLSLS
jgi:hypothetical protein